MSERKSLERVLKNTQDQLKNSSELIPDAPNTKVLMPNLNIVGTVFELESMFAESTPMTTGEDYKKAYAEFWVSPREDNSSWDNKMAQNRAINEWCNATYGPRGDWSDPTCRWYTSAGKYIFHSEQDRTMFVLRWS